MQQAETITGRPTDARELFEKLYLQAFPKVARYIASRGGSLEEAKDIFQDALVIYYERTYTPGFAIQASAEAYLLGTARHLWRRRQQKDNKKLSLSIWCTDIAAPERPPDIHTAKLLDILERTGRKCMDLLRSIYFEGRSAKETARVHNYSNEHSAAVQKYKCLEKIRETVKENAMTYEAFTE